MGVSNRITVQKYTQIKDYIQEMRDRGFSVTATDSMVQDKFKVGETTARLVRLTTNYQAYRLRTTKSHQPKQLVYKPELKKDVTRAHKDSFMLGVVLCAGMLVLVFLSIGIFIVIFKSVFGGIK